MAFWDCRCQSASGTYIRFWVIWRHVPASRIRCRTTSYPLPLACVLGSLRIRPGPKNRPLDLHRSPPAPAHPAHTSVVPPFHLRSASVLPRLTTRLWNGCGTEVPRWYQRQAVGNGAITPKNSEESLSALLSRRNDHHALSLPALSAARILRQTLSATASRTRYAPGKRFGLAGRGRVDPLLAINRVVPAQTGMRARWQEERMAGASHHYRASQPPSTARV